MFLITVDSYLRLLNHSGDGRGNLKITVRQSSVDLRGATDSVREIFCCRFYLKTSYLFHFRWVLTAAHCLPEGENTNKVIVFIGNIYAHINRRKATEKIRAKAIFIHPNYAGNGFKGKLDT